MVFTRQEKEKLIEDLYDRGKTYPQIAKEVRVSVRDIRPVLEKEERERERKLGLTNQDREKNNSNNPQPQGPSVASQAYLLFSEGKTPLEVAVQLHIREKESTKYYREHWKLKGLYRFNQIYEDYKDDIPHILKLNRKMKAAGIGIEQAINLIKIASDGLPAVEQKYQRLRSEVNLMESRKFKEYRSLRNLQVQIADSKRILKLLRMSCQEKEDGINQLQREEIRLQRLVKVFKNNNEEYLKITKRVRNKVSTILFDSKGLIRLAFYSLMESMRKDPEKYSSLIHYARNNNSSSTGWYNDGQYNRSLGYDKYPYQFNSYDPFFEALKSTLLQDANKLYEQLLKEQTATIISSYGSNWKLSLLPKSIVSNLRSQTRLMDSQGYYDDTRVIK
jgi:hypothetical protein